MFTLAIAAGTSGELAARLGTPTSGSRGWETRYNLGHPEREFMQCVHQQFAADPAFAYQRSMSDIVIRAENLGKRYRIGEGARATSPCATCWPASFPHPLAFSKHASPLGADRGPARWASATSERSAIAGS